MLILSIFGYQISNVQCFEYPISNELYSECQIANVQYQKTVQIHIQILRFGFVFASITYSICQILNIECFEYPLSSQLHGEC